MDLVLNDELELRRLNLGVKRLNEGKLEEAEKIFQNMADREICAQVFYYLAIIELRRKHAKIKKGTLSEADMHEQKAGKYLKRIKTYEEALKQEGHEFSEEMLNAMKGVKS